jgi:GTP-binding protein HflX
VDHLGQQGGGIGGRGGESQLEQDKRKSDCRSIGSNANWKRCDALAPRNGKTASAPVPNAAIVGYTNVGKSALLRRLTGADVFIANKLFATLDTTTRKIALPNKQPLLLTDTVGFVRKLPHQLVEAFNATLEEAAVADFLIHVLDASQAEVMEFYNTTMSVLTDLGASASRCLSSSTRWTRSTILPRCSPCAGIFRTPFLSQRSVARNGRIDRAHLNSSRGAR